jgi:hypothetical protein
MLGVTEEVKEYPVNAKTLLPVISYPSGISPPPYEQHPDVEDPGLTIQCASMV